MNTQDLASLFSGAFFPQNALAVNIEDTPRTIVPPEQREGRDTISGIVARLNQFRKVINCCNSITPWNVDYSRIRVNQDDNVICQRFIPRRLTLFDCILLQLISPFYDFLWSGFACFYHRVRNWRPRMLCHGKSRRKPNKCDCDHQVNCQGSLIQDSRDHFVILLQEILLEGSVESLLGLVMSLSIRLTEPLLHLYIIVAMMLLSLRSTSQILSLHTLLRLRNPGTVIAYSITSFSLVFTARSKCC
jgi:hypothetical protein